MEVRHAIIGEYFSVDDTGKSMMAGIFAQVGALEFPSSLPDSMLMLVFETDEGETPDLTGVHIEYHGGNPDTHLSTYNYQPNEVAGRLLEGEMSLFFLKVLIGGLLVPTPGKYYFDVYKGNTLMATAKLTAKVGNPSK